MKSRSKQRWNTQQDNMPRVAGCLKLHPRVHAGHCQRNQTLDATHTPAPDIMVSVYGEGDHEDCGRLGSGNLFLGADAKQKFCIL